MSKRTKSVPTSQAQAPTTEQLFQAPEQGAAAVQVTTTTEQPPVQEPTVPAAVQAEQPAAEAPAPAEQSPAQEQEPAAPQQTPEALLKAFVAKAKSAATAALEMGRLAKSYTATRMLLSDKVTRDVCVKCLANAWQEHSDDAVAPARVNLLIRTAATWELFNASTGHKPGKVALRVVREFAPLCERKADSRAEEWFVAPALEQQARELWAEATGKGLNGEECAAAVAELLNHQAKRQADAAKEERERKEREQSQAEATRRAEVEAMLAKQREVAALEEQQRQLAQAEQTPQTEAKRAELTAAMEKAKQDLQAQQQTALAAGRQEEQAAKQVQAAAKVEEQAAKQADKAQETAAAKQDKAEGKGQDASKPGPKPRAQAKNLLPAAAKQGTVKDVAEMAAELVTGSDTPDDVLVELLRQLKGSGELSKSSVRALDAALIVLERSERTNPVNVAARMATAAPLVTGTSTNGHAVPA
jgi:hypothetical protein